jgi:hypothetical protein
MQISHFSLKQNGMSAPYIGMKTYKSKQKPILLLILMLTGCTDWLTSSYTLELPYLPENWVSILGEPCWRIEWIDAAGQKHTADMSSCSIISVQLITTSISPVSAWPYWPDHNLIPGLFKPAGALYPFDVSDGRLHLSWEAGIDAFFYTQLLNGRHPANFNWLRFRELFNTGNLSEEVLNDPWVVDWISAAERTVSGSFDRRRLVPEANELKIIPVPAGKWYSTSPFAEPLFFQEGETSIFPIRSGINTWISCKGILKANKEAWIFTEITK